jgi:uncharacterized integral membrane protein
MQRFKVWSIGIAVVLLLVVILQNTASIRTRILWLEFEMPQAVLLFLCLAIGFGIGYLTCTLRRRHAAKKA